MCSMQSCYVHLSVLLIEGNSTREKTLRLCIWSMPLWYRDYFDREQNSIVSSFFNVTVSSAILLVCWAWNTVGHRPQQRQQRRRRRNVRVWTDGGVGVRVAAGGSGRHLHWGRDVPPGVRTCQWHGNTLSVFCVPITPPCWVLVLFNCLLYWCLCWC